MDARGSTRNRCVYISNALKRNAGTVFRRQERGISSILDSSRLYLSAECCAGTSPALSAHFSTGDRIQHRTHSCWLASNTRPLLMREKKWGVS
jgi:hypothetical protein